MTFAKQLQAARAAAGLSQSKAAVPLIEAGILGSVRTLQNWELGRGETLPAYKQAAALAALRPQKKARSRKGQNDQTAMIPKKGEASIVAGLDHLERITLVPFKSTGNKPLYLLEQWSKCP